MANIFPFRGLTYNRGKIDNFSKVVAPPYDVISPAHQAELYDRSPHNVVRIDFCRDADPYETVPQRFREWQEDGTLVPEDAPGLTRADARDALGVRGLGCRDVVLEDVRLGADARLGAPGDGCRVRDWALDGARVATAALAVGVGQAALAETLAYARRPQAEGTAPGRPQSVSWTLADTATDVDAARLLVLKAAAAWDRQQRCTLEASMAKLAAAEAAQRTAERTMQLLAAAAYERGSTAERLLRDARAAEIGQGTSAVQRLTIAAELLGEASGLRTSTSRGGADRRFSRSESGGP